MAKKKSLAIGLIDQIPGVKPFTMPKLGTISQIPNVEPLTQETLRTMDKPKYPIPFVTEPPKQAVDSAIAAGAMNPMSPTEAVQSQATLEDMATPEVKSLLEDLGVSMPTAGKGQKAENKGSVEQMGRDKVASQRTAYMGQDEWSDLINQAATSPIIAEAIAQDKDFLAKLENMRKAYKPEIDMSPILSYIDWATGTKYAPQYEKPVTKEAYAKAILGYEEEARKRQNDRVKNILDMVKSMKAGTDTNEYLNQLTQAMSQSRVAGVQAGSGEMTQNQVATKLFDLRKRFIDEGKSLREQLAAAKNIAVLGDMHNWLTLAGQAAQAARLMGAQPLSNFDIQMYQSDPALMRRLRSTYFKLREGKPTPEHALDYQLLAAAYIRQTNKVLREKQGDFRKLGVTMGLPEVGVEDALRLSGELTESLPDLDATYEYTKYKREMVRAEKKPMSLDEFRETGLKASDFVDEKGKLKKEMPIPKAGTPVPPPAGAVPMPVNPGQDDLQKKMERIRQLKQQLGVK